MRRRLILCRKKRRDLVKTMENYICLDLETTGLNPKTDKIIEIGALKIKQGREAGRFTSFVNPHRILGETVMQLTGITQEQVNGAPSIEEILPNFLEFSEDLPLLGHSILFDFSFLKRAAVNRRLSFEREGVDTLKIARKYLPELPSRKLEYLCEYFQIPHQAHRAIGDVMATVRLYEILCEKFSGMAEENGEYDKVFHPAPLIYQVKREGPITKVQKERLKRMVDTWQISIDYEIDSLTKNEASRKIDKLIAQYGILPKS